MPLDRRKAPAAVDDPEKVLTLRDVEEAYQQRVRSSKKKRPRIKRSITKTWTALFCGGCGITVTLVMVVVGLFYYNQKIPQPHHQDAQEEVRLHHPQQQRDTLSDANTDQHLVKQHHAANQKRVAWLMSFPNSGTSFTSRLVRDVSQTDTASNYADETPLGQQGMFVPVFGEEQPAGPFWTNPEQHPQNSNNNNNNSSSLSSPSLILTKTHCGIRCNPCGPEQMAETTYSFKRRCLVTKWFDATTNTNQYGTYPADRVAKAVHLFRNPFDNVVSRFHLLLKQDATLQQQYTPDKTGFLKYCLSVDYRYTDSETAYLHFGSNKLLQALWQVPCHADFLRYVEWHNLAAVTAHDLQLERLVVHYHEYADDVSLNATLHRLLDFLELPYRAPPALPFEHKSYYREYFSATERRIVKEALQFAASRETWEQIRRYF